jgi:hypothetical protein
VEPVPDSLRVRKSGSAGNRTRHLCVSSQELLSLQESEARGNSGQTNGANMPRLFNDRSIGWWGGSWGTSRRHSLSRTRLLTGSSVNIATAPISSDTDPRPAEPRRATPSHAARVPTRVCKGPEAEHCHSVHVTLPVQPLVRASRLLPRHAIIT